MVCLQIKILQDKCLDSLNEHSSLKRLDSLVGSPSAASAIDPCLILISIKTHFVVKSFVSALAAVLKWLISEMDFDKESYYTHKFNFLAVTT